jgi:hypothetical protein
MGRKPGSNSGALALPPQMNAAADVHVRFDEVVAECFRRRLKGDVEASTKAISEAAKIPHDAYRRAFRTRFWATRLSLVLTPVGVAVLVAHYAGEFVLSPAPFMLAFIAALAMVLVPIGWHSWQYAYGFPQSPLPVAHETDSIVETIFAALQAPQGPRLMVRVPLTGQYWPLDQRICFGRLRYLLLSRFREQRSDVTAFPYPWYLSGDLYLTPAGADRLIAVTKPPRKGGPGRTPLYDYVSAKRDVSRKYAKKRLPSDPDAACKLLEDELIGWFKELNDPSCKIPFRHQVKNHAAEIYRKRSTKS